MKIVNLTPHSVNFLTANGDLIQQVPPSGIIARCAVSEEYLGSINNLPVYKATYGEVTGLPAPVVDTGYIVSSLVAQAVPERKDLFIPHKLQRDENGRIIGCSALARP